MKEQVFNTDNVWYIHSPRTKESWLVRCPSRSGAKIFLTGPLGPKVPAAAGPFESELMPPESIPEGAEILQAQFYSAIDQRNYDKD